MVALFGWKARSSEKTAPVEKELQGVKKSHLGILAADTDEVPGSVILLSSVANRNEPLGLQHAHARTSASSLPSPYSPSRTSFSTNSRRSSARRYIPKEKKRTDDGRFILEPQPEDSANDPLNWKQLRRDVALVSLGFYCMIGGGMTPVLAAGFHNVSQTYDVSVPQVALTTGLYMLGLGIGSVIASPTAILFGKRPVYLVAIVLFCMASVWCAFSPSYISLLVARIVQGLAVSPVECLPSATIAEIFFLHERAYRLGMYTLLLLGGKNLIPLVSAAVVQSLGWRWVFKIVAIVVALCFFLIFFFVPETFWDRTPHPRSGHHKRAKSNSPSRGRLRTGHRDRNVMNPETVDQIQPASPIDQDADTNLSPRKQIRHVDFAAPSETDPAGVDPPSDTVASHIATLETNQKVLPSFNTSDPLNGLNEPRVDDIPEKDVGMPNLPKSPDQQSLQLSIHYTDYYRSAPPKSYIQSLKPWNGRLVKDSWLKVMIRPFILFAYPAVLWSSLVYALAVGWLIVLSESVTTIYQNRQSYNFTPLQIGLVYVSPFIGGVLGTAVAGKISDIVVRFMARKNDGVYEPEFRLIMAIPITISTVTGLMGFGWSAEEKDKWIVPTVFFGIISFGCALASTTAVTFVVDSYRQYAGEALVTLNFCKNVLHGFVFSLFFTRWLESSGSKDTFIAVGGIQLGCMLFSIPMYIFGKRARMWTVRRNLMERF